MNFNIFNLKFILLIVSYENFGIIEMIYCNIEIYIISKSNQNIQDIEMI